MPGMQRNDIMRTGITDENVLEGISILRDTRILTSDGVFSDVEGKQDLISFVRRKSI